MIVPPLVSMTVSSLSFLIPSTLFSFKLPELSVLLMQCFSSTGLRSRDLISTLLDFIESASGTGVVTVVSVFKGGVGSRGDFFLGRCVCVCGGEEEKTRVIGDEEGG